MHGKTSVRVAEVPADTIKIHKHKIRINRHSIKNTWIVVLNRITTIYTLIKLEPKEYERM